MPPNDGLKRYFEAAMALTQITRARAEEVVRDLIHNGEVESTRAQEWVEDLVKQSRQRSETIVNTIRGEVRTQLRDVGITNVDDLAKRVAAILDRAENAARRATSRGSGGKKKASAKKAAAKKAPAKKAAAKKAAAKKAPAKKAAAAKKTTKKAPAKKAAARTATRRA